MTTCKRHTSQSYMASLNSGLLLTAAAVLSLFVSCQQDTDLDLETGDTATAHITLGIDNTCLSATRAGASVVSPDLTSMRTTIVVSCNDKVVAVKTDSSCDFSSGGISFDIQLVPDKSYQVSAWADFGTEYYILPQIGSVPEVCIATSLPGSDYRLDAYTGTGTLSATGSTNSLSLTLARPFALLKVSTTDIPSSFYAGGTYTTTLTAPTHISLTTGAVSDSQPITISGSLLSDIATDGVKPLTLDYILASPDKTILSPFTTTYTSASDPSVTSSYTFSSIPIQRNYMTNIAGKIIQ